MAGSPQVRMLKEFLDMDKERSDAYEKAIAGIAPGPAVKYMPRAYLRTWEESFGFSLFQMGMAIGPGTTFADPHRPAYVEGEFDAAGVHEKLLALGYQERQAAGRTYHAIGEDFETSLRSPVRFAFGTMNRAYLDDNTLVAAPATEMVEDILETWSGRRPSLGDDPAFASVARALGDPLSAAVLPRTVALDVSGVEYARSMWVWPTVAREGSHTTSTDTPRHQLRKQDGWGTLRQWQAVGVGYSRTEDGRPWYTFALYYPERHAAAADAEELRHRMESYESAVPEEVMGWGWLEQPLQVCGPLAVSVVEDGEGSTLAVWCPVEEPSAMWYALLDARDVAFLVP